MTRQAVVRYLPGSMTVDAETHVHIDDTLGDGLLRDVAVTCRTLDARANVRRVVELHVGFGGVAVHALPREIDAALVVVGKLLNDRSIVGDRIVTDHAGLDARESGDWPFRCALVAVVGAGQPF